MNIWRMQKKRKGGLNEQIKKNHGEISGSVKKETKTTRGRQRNEGISDKVREGREGIKESSNRTSLEFNTLPTFSLALYPLYTQVPIPHKLVAKRGEVRGSKNS